MFKQNNLVYYLWPLISEAPQIDCLNSRPAKSPPFLVHKCNSKGFSTLWPALKINRLTILKWMDSPMVKQSLIVSVWAGIIMANSWPQAATWSKVGSIRKTLKDIYWSLRPWLVLSTLSLILTYPQQPKVKINLTRLVKSAKQDCRLSSF